MTPLSQNFFFDWADDAEAQQAEFDRIATSAPALATVRQRSKRDRTPNLKLMCGNHPSGVSLTLSAAEGNKVSLEYLTDTSMDPLDFGRLGVVGNDDVAPVFIKCMECGKKYSRKPVVLLTESLRLLAAITAGRTTRPVIQL